MRNLLSSICLSIIVSTGAPVAFADKPPVYTGVFSDLGVGGYDVVAYFQDAKPINGDKRFVTEHLGAEYRFVSQESLDAFLEAPEQYLPQYGGYCAWAIAEGNTAKGDPKHWKIVNGKLYLNYNKTIQERWEADIPGFIKVADQNWPSVLAD